MMKSATLGVRDAAVSAWRVKVLVNNVFNARRAAGHWRVVPKNGAPLSRQR